MTSLATVQKIRESDWQRTVIDAAHALGWAVAHFRPVRVQRGDGSVHYCTPVQADGAGWPDLFLVRAPRAIAAELKVGSNKVSEAQRVWLERLADCDIETYTWRPRDWPEVEKVLR